MGDPLDALRTAEVAILFAIFAGATLSWGALLPALKPSIVHLELARTTGGAQKVIAAWRAGKLLKAAKRSVLLDLVWIACYAPALATLGVLAGRAADSSTTAALLTYAALAAGALDYVENVGLWRLLAGHTAQPWPAATTLVSGSKWLLIVASLAGAAVLFVVNAITAVIN